MPASNRTRELALKTLRQAGKPLTAAEIAIAIGARVHTVHHALYRALEDGVDLRRHHEPRDNTRPLVFWRLAD